ncbi:uncharacterized protein J3R85_006539 [Psidium guajava]|nr:uncharacterized protein J3R85_006539 [Psidium guajava]
MSDPDEAFAEHIQSVYEEVTAELNWRKGFQEGDLIHVHSKPERFPQVDRREQLQFELRISPNCNVSDYHGSEGIDRKVAAAEDQVRSTVEEP